MTSKELIELLKPLEGNCVGTFVDGNEVYNCRFSRVIHLTPDLRIDSDAGNVMLHTGTYDKNGYPEGLTVWAKNVDKVTWADDNTCIVLAKNDALVVFVIHEY